jgi:hypothetical protein
MTMNPRITGRQRWKAIVGPLERVVLTVLLVGAPVTAAQVVVKLLRRCGDETLLSVAL